MHMVVEKSTGKEYAAKSIAKRLSVPNISANKQKQHIENIKREALILFRLRGTLNVVHLEVRRLVPPYMHTRVFLLWGCPASGPPSLQLSLYGSHPQLKGLTPGLRQLSRSAPWHGVWPKHFLTTEDRMRSPAQQSHCLRLPQDCFECEDSVHLIMENCKVGGVRAMGLFQHSQPK